MLPSAIEFLKKEFYNLIVVTPIGPRCPVAYILDNIESILFYTRGTCKIVLVVEPKSDEGREIKRHYPEVDVIESPKAYPKNGGLFLKVSHAYKHVVEHYSFDALLRMDADALVIGPEPEREVIEMFRANPNIAIAGQYPLQYNGKPWNTRWGRKEILKAITWQLPRRPQGNFAILTLYLKAIKYGYKAGDMVFGGVCFLSEKFLTTLYAKGLLPYYDLGKCWLEEDHQFSLLAKAYGFQFGDLSSGDLPFACDWLALPASPQELFERGKKIIHSTRKWQDMKEDEIRAFFKQKRERVRKAEKTMRTAI
jgi:hypothetical protein